MARKDRTHLEKFATCFDNYYSIYDSEREHPSSRIRITSKQCCLDLLQYGITPAKSLTLNVKTDLIPIELQRHYIRGYFDGDGSIFCSHSNRASGYNYDEWGCNFVGTKAVLTFIQKFLKLSNPPRKKKNMNCYSLDISGVVNTYEKLLVLYEDATIYLDRKKDKFDELRSSQRLNKLVSKRNYFAEEKETSIIVGLILGGGNIKNNQLRKTTNKKERLEYVQNIFEKYNYKTDLKTITAPSLKGKITYELDISLALETAKHYKHLFYPNGDKTITRHLLNELNNDALSIWLTLNSRDVDGGISFGTTCFNEAENIIIQHYFQTVHNYDARLRKQRDKVYIHLTAKDTQDLLTKVYVPRGT